MFAPNETVRRAGTADASGFQMVAQDDSIQSAECGDWPSSALPKLKVLWSSRGLEGRVWDSRGADRRCRRCKKGGRSSWFVPSSHSHGVMIGERRPKGLLESLGNPGEPESAARGIDAHTQSRGFKKHAFRAGSIIGRAVEPIGRVVEGDGSVERLEMGARDSVAG